MTPLTARQAEALAFIRRYVGRRGIGPTMREIAEAMGMAGHTGAYCHVAALARKGYLRSDPAVARGIVLLGEPPPPPRRAAPAPEKGPPTRRQAEVLAFIRRHRAEVGYPPTLKEICAEFGFASRYAALSLVRRLRAKGWLAPAPRARASRSLVEAP